MKEYIGNCELCGRWRPRSFHYLIPRTCHRNKWFKKNFEKQEMAVRGLMLWRDCHRYVHDCYPEKELGKSYNTKEALLKDDKIAKFVTWVRGKK
jgi:hypothetical protein